MDKLITNCLLNKMGIRMAIFKSWYFVADLEIEEMEHNYFCFIFPSTATKAKVLEQSAWNQRTYAGFEALYSWCYCLQPQA